MRAPYIVHGGWSNRGSTGLRRHALIREFAPRLGGFFQGQPHAAQDMRRLGELDVAIIDHLEAIAPGVEEIHEGAVDQLGAGFGGERLRRRAWAWRWSMWLTSSWLELLWPLHRWGGWRRWQAADMHYP